MAWQGGYRTILKKLIVVASLAYCALSAAPVFPRTVVLYQKGFPSVDNGRISREALARALAGQHLVFADVRQLPTALGDGDLLVLPYGSAFPADDWEVIQRHIEKGNLVVLGGRPFYVPVYRDGNSWRVGSPQNTYSQMVGILYSYAAPLSSPWKLQWAECAPYFHVHSIEAGKVFVNAGMTGGYRGLAFLINANGDRLAAPVVAQDVMSSGPPRRQVFLSFDARSDYWNSDQAIELIRESSEYASFGGVRLYLDLQDLSLNPGDRVSGTVDVLRSGRPAKLTLELISGPKVLESRSVECGDVLHEPINFERRVKNPGLYRVRASLSFGDTVFDEYSSGAEVGQPGLLASGPRLTVGHNYFRLGGKPYMMAGINYFSTDPYGRAFFLGQSIGGNPYLWERDFSEMEKAGLTAVRTGMWMNRLRYLEDVSGAADVRLLDAIEAYLDAAAQHHIQVIFTFFAFNPAVEMQTGHGAGNDIMVRGTNAYVDPVSIKAEETFVRSIVERFKNVPFLSYDLINEPSYADLKYIWKGNSPTGGAAELEAWQRWLKKRYLTVDSLAGTWHVPASDFGSFSAVPLPDFADLQLARDNNSSSIRAVDYNHFVQDVFIEWVKDMVRTIRSTGSQQLVTVGQDEGGVTDRLLDQFIATSDVSFTSNHSWWQDDALLWDSVVPKNPFKPNLIEETGPQPAWSVDGTWRLDDVNGFDLEERKLVLAFANAGAGVLHWDWTHSDDFGILRRDGSEKIWMSALKGVAAFAQHAEHYAVDAKPPEIALVLPQSLQLSTFNQYAITEQQNAVRALYQYARGTAFAIGEYQLSQMPAAKLIIVPSPWVLSQEAWDELMAKVKEGATLLISGRVDADSHWKPIPSRTEQWDVDYSHEALRTRYAEVSWPGGSALLSYSGLKTTYLDRGVLGEGKTFAHIPLGKGQIFYFAFPLELSDRLAPVGEIYRYVMAQAGVTEPYETSCTDPGILIAPTQLKDATLYVFTSESTVKSLIEFRDNRSKMSFTINLVPGRSALMLVGKTGNIEASYNIH